MSIIAHITPVGTSVSGSQSFGTLIIMLTDAATGQPVNGNGIRG